MTKDKFDIDPNWKWGRSPIRAVCNNTCDDADADDEKSGYFQTETELCAAFLYEVIKPKLSEDMWDTLIKAIHNERVSSPTGRIQSIGRVLADFLVVGTFETEERSKEKRAAKERLLEELNDRATANAKVGQFLDKYYSATKFF